MAPIQRPYCSHIGLSRPSAEINWSRLSLPAEMSFWLSIRSMTSPGIRRTVTNTMRLAKKSVGISASSRRTNVGLHRASLGPLPFPIASADSKTDQLATASAHTATIETVLHDIHQTSACKVDFGSEADARLSHKSRAGSHSNFRYGSHRGPFRVCFSLSRSRSRLDPNRCQHARRWPARHHCRLLLQSALFRLRRTIR